MSDLNSRPNVIFILSDQHNAKVLGHKGHPYVKTPNLDKLAAEGVRFDNAITQNPICTPSRMSFLSGQYAHNHGYYGLSGKNPNGLPTMVGHFRKNGYKTAAIGKIHCPEYWIEDDCDLFIEALGTSVGGKPEYDRYLKNKGLYNTYLSEKYTCDWYGEQSCDGTPSKLEHLDCYEGFSVQQAVKFMESSLESNDPFFLHVSFPKPHQWYTPSKEFWDMYNDIDLEMPPNADYDMKGKAPHLIEAQKKWRGGGWECFEPKTYEAARLRKYQGYLGNITEVDYSVGELMDWLKENNLEENTIVVYSTDHGDYSCEHGIMEKAPGICSDAITRIPYIWKWKDHFKDGHVAEEIVETVDVSTTLFKLAGIEPLLTSDGKEIDHLLYGDQGEVHKIGVTEFAWSKSVRKGKFRYVYYPVDMFKDEYPEGFGELYDLENDPWEMTNLYFDGEYKDKILEMERDLMDWLITTTRPVTINGRQTVSESSQYSTRYGKTFLPDGKMAPINIEKIDGKRYL